MLEKTQQTLACIAVAVAIGAITLFLRAHPVTALAMALGPGAVMVATLLFIAIRKD